MSNACLESLIELGKSNEKIILISVDQPTGKDKDLTSSLGDRFLYEPISEANVIGMASGLAADGFLPYILNHATFNTRRCYEQIMLDACLQKRYIRLIGMGAGLATAHLGPTHTSVDDIALMRTIPGMTVFVPSDASEVKRIIPQTLTWEESIYIRLTKYGVPKYGLEIDYDQLGDIELGKAYLLTPTTIDQKVLLVSTGCMSPICLEVSGKLNAKNIFSRVLHISTIKPLDIDSLLGAIKGIEKVYFVEEHWKTGGLGSACIENLVEYLPPRELPLIKRLSLPDRYIHEYGDQKSLLDYFDLMPDKIEKRILADFSNS